MSKETEKIPSSTGGQSLILKDRKLLELSGAREVISFNEERILLQTTQGLLDIKGRGLNIHNLNLDNESIKIEGLITSLNYTDKSMDKGILQKLFK
ncbi:MAG: sporulation protein YabP [Halanaerobiaceae bacterium]|nr:sporulation protein YabP [Halanaerobiaceae bacterium]